MKISICVSENFYVYYFFLLFSNELETQLLPFIPYQFPTSTIHRIVAGDTFSLAPWAASKSSLRGGSVGSGIWSPPYTSKLEGKWDPLFQANLGCWNIIIIWPDEFYFGQSFSGWDGLESVFMGMRPRPAISWWSGIGGVPLGSQDLWVSWVTVVLW